MLPKMLKEIVEKVELKQGFKPAKLSQGAIWMLQLYIRIDLALHNHLSLSPADLQVLKTVPKGMGIILTPNHTDETDVKVCVEISRLSSRNFYYMANRKVFEEAFGLAGWLLPRLGAFSVDRGGEKGSLDQSKNFALDIVKQGQDILVMFPEGEISYLNDIVQPLKSGAIDVGLKAIVERTQTLSGWTAYVVPMTIKYRYDKSINLILEKRIQKLEKSLNRRVSAHKLQMRLGLIMAELLRRHEIAHNLKSGSTRLADLSHRVEEVRQSLLQQLEEKYFDAMDSPTRHGLLQRSWRLSSYIKGLPKGIFSKESLTQIRKDLNDLNSISNMAGWRPEYVELNPSQERIAEMVLNLEREVHQIKRPHQLARREVLVRIGEPIDLSRFIIDYQRDPHKTRHLVAERLRDILQSLVNRAEVD